nr:hypothetical protein [uncultured Bacillus sp.]
MIRAVQLWFVASFLVIIKDFIGIEPFINVWTMKFFLFGELDTSP